MDVGFGGRHNLHVIFGSQVEVDLDIAAGVNHNGLALGLAADEVASLGKAFFVDAFKEHGRSFQCSQYKNTPRGI